MSSRNQSAFRLLIAAVLMTVLNNSCGSEIQSTAETQIIALERGALERWCKGDPYGYVELAAPDITYFAEGVDTLIRGFKAFEQINATVKGKVSIPRFEMADASVRFIGDLGILTFVLHNYKPADQLRGRWRTTEIYRLIDGRWQIIHSHWTHIKTGA